MDVLGHSQIGLTMNTYSHVIPDLRRDAALRMDDLLNDRSGGRKGKKFLRRQKLLSHRATLSDYRQNCFVPLLGHAHLPHVGGVSGVSRDACRASAEPATGSRRDVLVVPQPNQHTI